MQAQTMQRAAVNGVELEYHVVGQGDPVLFISPVLADGFLPLLSEPSLAERYRLITYHKRGWGSSTHTDPPVTIGDHAADAAALLASLDVRRAHIVGHSSGAAVAAELALRNAEAVHTLSLLEMSLLSVPAAAAFLQNVAPAFEAYAAGRHDAAVASFMTVVSGLEWETCRSVLERNVPGAAAGATKDADTFFGIELPALGAWTFGACEAGRISHPVLSVRGSETARLWIEIAALLRSWIPQVEECTIEGAGHLLHVQRPAAVARELSDFFDRYPL